MKIRFNVARNAKHEDLLANAEIHFDEAGLKGLSLHGISLWRSKTAGGGIYVTLPRKSYGAGDPKHFDFLRGHPEALEALRATLAAEFVRQHPQIGGPAVIAGRVRGGFQPR